MMKEMNLLAGIGLAIVLIVLPLAAWKAVEVVLWFFSHVGVRSLP